MYVSQMTPSWQTFITFVLQLRENYYISNFIKGSL